MIRHFLFLSIVFLQVLSLKSQSTELFVSKNGSPNGNGSRIRPYADIGQALLQIKDHAGKQVIITVRKGDYRLDTTLVIDDQLLNGHSLLLRSYPGEKVTISGLQKLTLQWTPAADGMFVSSLARGLPIDQLFADGRLLTLARYPNIDSSQRVFNGTADDALAPARVRGWQDPGGGYVHALHEGEWGGFHYRIMGKDSSGHLQLEGGWQNNRPAPMHARYRFVENIYEELDAPGEWFYDDRRGLLYLKLSVGVNPAARSFEYTALDELVVIRGTEGKPTRDVEIRGIEFTGTNRTFMKTREPILRTDWTIYRGGALLIDHTENIRVRDCSFFGLGGNAIFVSNYNRKASITGNHIQNIGASAILLMGNADAVRSPSFQYNQFVPYSEMDLTPGPLSTNYPADCEVSDNLIHHIGTIEKQVAGLVIDMASRITASHNTIYNVPRSGINIGDGCFGGHVIEYNDVFNTVLETGDHGAFNSWGRDRFWLPSGTRVDSMVGLHPDLPFLDVVEAITLRYNRFQCSHGWDIDLDDGSSNYRIYGNLCLEGGLKLREGYQRIVYNNVLVNNSFHPHVWFKNSGDQFQHNIVSADYAPIGINDWGTLIDSNLFLRQSSLDNARKEGTDTNSLAGNPGFKNPAANDYTALDNALINRIGFKNFDMAGFGVTSLSLRKIAATPAATGIRIFQLTETGKPVEFLGATIKNVEGLGERSAAGLPDEDGILVVAAPISSLAGQSGLKPRDVIRTVNGKPVKDLVELFAAIQVVNWQGQAELGIIRDQSEQKMTLKFK